jgi:hypothetical protein
MSDHKEYANQNKVKSTHTTEKQISTQSKNQHVVKKPPVESNTKSTKINNKSNIKASTSNNEYVARLSDSNNESATRSSGNESVARSSGLNHESVARSSGLNHESVARSSGLNHESVVQSASVNNESVINNNILDDNLHETELLKNLLSEDSKCSNNNENKFIDDTFAHETINRLISDAMNAPVLISEDATYNNSLIGLQQVYDEKGEQLCIKYEEYLDDNNKTILYSVKDKTRRETNNNLIVDLITFLKNFKTYSCNQLEYIDMSNVFIAGESIYATITAIPEEYNSNNVLKGKYYNDIKYAGSEIDMYIFGLKDDALTAKILELEKDIREYLPYENITIKSSKGSTIVSQYPYKNINIIHKYYESPDEILSRIDIDAHAIGFNGENVFMSHRCINAFKYGCSEVNITRINPKFEERLHKYGANGNEIVLPKIDYNRINPIIFEEKINNLQGVAKLLVLERLSNKQDKYMDYIAKLQCIKCNKNVLITSIKSECFVPWGKEWNASNIVNFLKENDKICLKPIVSKIGLYEIEHKKDYEENLTEWHESAYFNIHFSNMLGMVSSNNYNDLTKYINANKENVLKILYMKDQYGKTLLLNACVNGLCDIAQTLIKYGSSIFDTTREGYNSIHIAIINNHTELAKILLDSIVLRVNKRVSDNVSNKIELVSDSVSRKMELVSDSVPRKIELVSDSVSKKIELVSDSVSRKIELVSDRAQTKVQNSNNKCLSDPKHKKVSKSSFSGKVNKEAYSRIVNKLKYCANKKKNLSESESENNSESGSSEETESTENSDNTLEESSTDGTDGTDGSDEGDEGDEGDEDDEDDESLASTFYSDNKSCVNALSSDREIESVGSAFNSDNKVSVNELCSDKESATREQLGISLNSVSANRFEEFTINNEYTLLHLCVVVDNFELFKYIYNLYLEGRISNALNEENIIEFGLRYGRFNMIQFIFNNSYKFAISSAEYKILLFRNVRTVETKSLKLFVDLFKSFSDEMGLETLLTHELYFEIIELEKQKYNQCDFKSNSQNILERINELDNCGALYFDPIYKITDIDYHSNILQPIFAIVQSIINYELTFQYEKEYVKMFFALFRKALQQEDIDLEWFDSNLNTLYDVIKNKINKNNKDISYELEIISMNNEANELWDLAEDKTSHDFLKIFEDNIKINNNIIERSNAKIKTYEKNNLLCEHALQRIKSKNGPPFEKINLKNWYDTNYMHQNKNVFNLTKQIIKTTESARSSNNKPLAPQKLKISSDNKAQEIKAEKREQYYNFFNEAYRCDSKKIIKFLETINYNATLQHLNIFELALENPDKKKSEQFIISMIEHFKKLSDSSTILVKLLTMNFIESCIKNEHVSIIKYLLNKISSNFWEKFDYLHIVKKILSVGNIKMLKTIVQLIPTKMHKSINSESIYSLCLDCSEEMIKYIYTKFYSYCAQEHLAKTDDNALFKNYNDNILKIIYATVSQNNLNKEEMLIHESNQLEKIKAIFETDIVKTELENYEKLINESIKLKLFIIAQFLINNYTERNSITTINNESNIILTMIKSKSPEANTLIEFDLSTKLNFGARGTLMHYCALVGNELILDRDNIYTKTDKYGMNILHYIIGDNFDVLIKYIKKFKGKECNKLFRQENMFGQTPTDLIFNIIILTKNNKYAPLYNRILENDKANNKSRESMTIETINKGFNYAINTVLHI